MSEKAIRDFEIDTNGLKPCPFCGHIAELRPVGVSEWTVRCTNRACYAEIAACLDPQTAIIKWNMRVYFEVDL
jgi:hypothetical protein